MASELGLTELDTPAGIIPLALLPPHPDAVSSSGWAAGSSTGTVSRRRDCHAVAPPALPLVAVLTGMERERQQNDSLANG